MSPGYLAMTPKTVADQGGPSLGFCWDLRGLPWKPGSPHAGVLAEALPKDEALLGARVCAGGLAAVVAELGAEPRVGGLLVHHGVIGRAHAFGLTRDKQRSIVEAWVFPRSGLVGDAGEDTLSDSTIDETVRGEALTLVMRRRRGSHEAVETGGSLYHPALRVVAMGFRVFARPEPWLRPPAPRIILRQGDEERVDRVLERGETLCLGASGEVVPNDEALATLHEQSGNAWIEPQGDVTLDGAPIQTPTLVPEGESALQLGALTLSIWCGAPYSS